MRTAKLNTFEKILLFIGIIVIILGFGLIQSKFIAAGSEISWDFMKTVLIWLVVVLGVLVLAVLENMREELSEVIQNQTQEIRLISFESRLLQKDMKAHHSGKKPSSKKRRR